MRGRNRAVAALLIALALAGCGRKSQLPPLPPRATLQQYARIIRQQAASNHVPPALVAAVIVVESSGNARAVGASGSIGLMQLKRTTAAQYGITDLFDPAANIAAGTRYLRDLLARFRGSIPLALAAYRSGPATVAAAHGVPAASSSYVARVTAVYDAILREGIPR